MLLGRVHEPFDDSRYVFEPKLDGFRALAFIDGDRTQLVSRRNHVLKGFDAVVAALPLAVRAKRAVLDGELVCLADDGRPVFRPLLARRGQCYFYAFDALSVDGEDIRDRPLIQRKGRLRRLLQRSDVIRYLDHMRGRGCDLFKLAVAHDLEGVVAKLASGNYVSGDRVRTSWFKVLNRHYSQREGRHELFDRRRSATSTTALRRGTGA